MTQAVMPLLHPVLTRADCSRAVLGADFVTGPHTQVGLKPELSPRGGVTKKEEQKSFCAVAKATA